MKISPPEFKLAKFFQLSALVFILGSASSSLGAIYTWDVSTDTGLQNGDGTWSTTNATWNLSGVSTTWLDGNDAYFGADTSSNVASPDGDYTITVDGSVSVNALRQMLNGAGNYTLNGSSITISGANGVRSDHGVFTVNSNLTRSGTSSVYLAASSGATLVLGGTNTFSGSVYLQTGTGTTGTIQLNSAQALGTGSQTISILSNDVGGAILDLNGYTLSKTGLIQNAPEGSTASAVAGTAYLVNNNATTAVTVANQIVLRSTRKLGFGGSGAGLVLSGVVRDSTTDSGGVFYTTGTGNLTLSSATGNTYTGGTVVSGVTLRVTNTSGSGTGTGAVQVNAGATLGGTGYISGATAISGNLAPGLSSSTGVLTFTGGGNALTLSSTANTTIRINSLTSGSGHDQVVLNGSDNVLTLDGTLTLSLSVAIADGTYDLFSFTSKTGDFDAVAFDGDQYSGTFTFDGTDSWIAISQGQEFVFSESLGDLVVTSVPEPGAVTLLLTVLGAVVGFRRRAKS